MKETRILMGMPITVEIIGDSGPPAQAGAKNGINAVFDYFDYVDQTFSTFKETSEITKINKGLLQSKEYSQDMKTVFELSEKTKKQTNGYFDIVNNQGKYDPSGLVKGWAIYNAAQILKNQHHENFYIEAGGDVQVHGKNSKGEFWTIGIKNPFKPQEIVKAVYLKNNEGIATSGNYERGSHIYNPKDRKEELAKMVSITVIGPNVYEADRFATAAFAMQEAGICFIESLPGFEGYMIDVNGIGTETSNFEQYTR